MDNVKKTARQTMGYALLVVLMVRVLSRPALVTVKRKTTRSDFPA